MTIRLAPRTEAFADARSSALAEPGDDRTSGEVSLGSYRTTEVTAA